MATMKRFTAPMRAAVAVERKPVARMLPQSGDVTLPSTAMGQLLSTLIEVKTKKAKPKSEDIVGALMLDISRMGFATIAAPTPDLLLQDWMGKAAPGKLLERIHLAFGLGRDQMASFLEVTPKTVIDREKKDLLSFGDAERLIRYARVWSAAAAVFEDANYATEWLHKPNEALGGRVPFELLKGAQGETAVLRELSHIEYGLPV